MSFLLRYHKHKLVRFTGVPLTSLVECGDLAKQKQRIKTNQCAPGWARISERATLDHGKSLFYIATSQP